MVSYFSLICERFRRRKKKSFASIYLHILYTWQLFHKSTIKTYENSVFRWMRTKLMPLMMMTTPLIFVITNVMFYFRAFMAKMDEMLFWIYFYFSSKIRPIENLIACAWCSYESQPKKKLWKIFCIPSTSKLAKLQFMKLLTFFFWSNHFLYFRKENVHSQQKLSIWILTGFEWTMIQ